MTSPSGFAAHLCLGRPTVRHKDSIPAYGNGVIWSLPNRSPPLCRHRGIPRHSLVRQRDVVCDESSHVGPKAGAPHWALGSCTATLARDGAETWNLPVGGPGQSAFQSSARVLVPCLLGVGVSGSGVWSGGPAGRPTQRVGWPARVARVETLRVLGGPTDLFEHQTRTVPDGLPFPPPFGLVWPDPCP